jgi:tuftelin-interacting protein 11
MADLSFKERIQAFAVDRGLLFVPRVVKFYSGTPVYEFGTTNVCIDPVKRVVYAQLLKESESWTAISLKHLMEMNVIGGMEDHASSSVFV